MFRWEYLGIAIVLLWIARFIYSRVAPHGSVVRVPLDGRSCCGAMTPGGHVFCRCGAESPHVSGIRVWVWRSIHREQVKHPKPTRLPMTSDERYAEYLKWTKPKE